MKALVYTGTQELVYREEPNPIKVSGESILKIHASGICGSDMHAYHGHDERRNPPLILGHEVSGEVQNGKFKGKNVVLNPLITCGKCEYCTSGREHLCPHRVLLGMNKPIERQGAFAELNVPIIKNIDLRGEYFIGENITDLRGGVLFGINVVRDIEVFSSGYWGELRYRNKKLTLATGYGRDDPKDLDLEPLNPSFNEALWAVIHIQLKDNLRVGLEYLQWVTEYKDSVRLESHRINSHIQWSF